MKKSIRFAAILTAAALAATACGQSAEPVSATSTVVTVGTAFAERGEISKETAYSGRISPGESVYVIGKVAGTVKETYAEVGQSVKAGQLLYEIDPVDVEMSVAQAKAAYDAVQAQIDQSLGSGLDSQSISAQSAYKQAKFAYDAAEDAVDALYDKYNPINNAIKKIDKGNESAYDDLAKALANLNKASTSGSNSSLKDNDEDSENTGSGEDTPDSSDHDTLYEEGKTALATLKASIDQAETAYDQAKTAYTSARSAYYLVTGDATDQAQAVGDASIEQAKAAYNMALAQLDYCKVTSPINGIVELKNVTEGNMASQSSYAYVISNKDTMCVTFGVPAAVAQNLQIGDTITVENGSVTHTAEIVEIASMVDQTSGLFKIKANITDDSGDLLTGVAVKLTATTAHKEDVLLVPNAALYYDDGSAYVYIAENGVAVKTSVTVGIVANDMAEITSGLKEGDEVITTWSTNLRDGAAVAVEEG